MILLSHPTGNESVRHAALALAEADLLAEFDTCLSWGRNSLINKILPSNMRKELERRSLPEEVRIRTKTFPLRETGRLLAQKLNLGYLMKHETGFFSIDKVYRGLDQKVARRLSHFSGIEAVYAYEDGALEIFREAHRRGIKCIYDLPIGYYRAAQKIYAEEAAF